MAAIDPYESPKHPALAAPRPLTLWRATSYVLMTSGGGMVLGGSFGLLIGFFIPEYYRTIFRQLDGPTFNPLAMGGVLGATQGLIVGAGIGFVILIIYVWYLTRRKV